MGLAQFSNIFCNECDWNQKSCSSKECSRDSNSSERNHFDLNKRSLIAFREKGQSYAAMTTFCWFINMPSPMAQTTFDDLNSDLHNAYVQTAQESMAEAAKTGYKNLANINTNTNSNCLQNAKFSGDGAWQKRGYSSLNGVVTLISDGKCIGTEVLSKRYKQCEQWKHWKDRVEYHNWKEDHIYAINHTGSAGAMEVVGLKKIFQRSECLHNLWDTFYFMLMEILNLLKRFKNLILIQATQLLKENALDRSRNVSVHVFDLSRLIMWEKTFLKVKKLDVGKEGWPTKW